MAFSQSQLIQKTKDFTANALRADIQAVISPIGYNAAALAVGVGHAEAVANGIAQTKDQKSIQTSATRREKKLRAETQTLVTAFADTARILFAGDPDALLSLGLETQHETIPAEGEGEPTTVVARPSRGTAESISRWRTMFQNASTFTGDRQTALAGVGWDIDRLNAALDAVEAYANANTAQQAAIGDYQARSAQHKKDVETLRQWYNRASGLCKVALKTADPANDKQWLETLGLA